MSAFSTRDDPMSVIFQALWDRWAQLEMGRDGRPADEARAAELRRGIEAAWSDHKAGALKLDSFRRWAEARVPWLHNTLNPPPQAPRRGFVPPAVPPPSAAHAAVAARIVRGDVARPDAARYNRRGGEDG